MKTDYGLLALVNVKARMKRGWSFMAQRFFGRVEDKTRLSVEA
jgi:hypothetical protein